jgi:hypothetical protein
MSTAFVMQAVVLVHAVARVPEAFMVQAAAVGPSAEDRVAAGSCGSSWSFGRGLRGGSVESVGSLVESRMVACLQQLTCRQRVVWQLTFVGAVGPTTEDRAAALIAGVLVRAVVTVPDAFMMGAVVSLMQWLHV